MRIWGSLEEELASLEQSAVARSLIDDLEHQSPERVAQFLAELTKMEERYEKTDDV